MVPAFEINRVRLRKLWTLTLVFAAALIAGAASGQEAMSRLTITVFWQEGCPHCAAAHEALEPLAAADERVILDSRELMQSDADDALFLKLLTLFEHDQVAVPLVVIGPHSFLGHHGEEQASRYREAIDHCLQSECIDPVGAVEALSATIFDRTPETPHTSAEQGQHSPTGQPREIRIPFYGSVDTADLSLPALTVLMAAIDGFNPCAMWVLVFLIGLLLGLQDSRRMWILGLAFLGATGLMYFAVMAAWLNIVLYLSAIAWVRIGVALLAVGGGLYYLREYWTKPEGVCLVTSPGQRGRVMTAFRSVVNHYSLPLAVIGIMGLAILVNFIELLCSAGIPAVYTQMLALNDLPVSAYYGYLGLYILVFMLDDLAIFATAMFALRAAGLTGGYARFSHLIGGAVLLVIGAVMALRPDLLAFA